MFFKLDKLMSNLINLVSMNFKSINLMSKKKYKTGLITSFIILLYSFKHLRWRIIFKILCTLAYLSLVLTSGKMNFSLNFSWEIVFSNWCEHILISHWQCLSDILAWNSVRKISKRFEIFLTEFFSRSKVPTCAWCVYFA